MQIVPKLLVAVLPLVNSNVFIPEEVPEENLHFLDLSKSDSEPEIINMLNVDGGRISDINPTGWNAN